MRYLPAIVGASYGSEPITRYTFLLPFHEVARTVKLPHELLWFQDVVRPSAGHALNSRRVAALAAQIDPARPTVFVGGITVILVTAETVQAELRRAASPEGVDGPALTSLPGVRFVPNDSDPEAPEPVQEQQRQMGRLYLDPTVSLVALDGRARVAAIRQAVRARPEVANWDLSINALIFPGVARTAVLFGQLQQSVSFRHQRAVGGRDQPEV